LVVDNDSALAQAGEVASALLGAPAQVLHLPTVGRNSRIYRVCCRGREFALKKYPPREHDGRERLKVEVGALQLMQRAHLYNVPRVVGVDHDRDYALLTWIDGAPIVDPTDTDIDAAVAFLAAIHRLRHAAGAAGLGLAAEACLAGAEIERQIETRLVALRRLQEPELLAFLDDAFVPAYRQALDRAKCEMRAAGVDFAGELPQERRSLVPSDFGFHNSLRRPDGSLAFVDFEYFGWDDPVKLTADILLHPGMSLAPTQWRSFRRAAEHLYGADRTFAQRLRCYLPLFAMRWALIVLNEFIPERWHRRALAGATESWEGTKHRQLALARNMISPSSHAAQD
jgi:hypothetical protein